MLAEDEVLLPLLPSVLVESTVVFPEATAVVRPVEVGRGMIDVGRGIVEASAVAGSSPASVVSADLFLLQYICQKLLAPTTAKERRRTYPPIRPTTRTTTATASKIQASVCFFFGS